nr:hypothetical protein [Tanacetum cinerariifolium]
MTGNISYLSEYEPYDGGYVSFGQGGEKITGKGIIKTGKLEFENVYFVKELKFTWTFFLRTKDETSSILRNFIIEIENLKDLKVKIIRYDNGVEFKNKEMNEFCTKKGIRREFSNARTPQQNRVAERRNRTLIEAARTMLADAKLPVTFWAEAATLLVMFKTRPFGCYVMILNTLDHLRKFDAKGDEGYFVGYFMSSKAFKVFNKRTKKVEENLHVDFLENKLIEKGAGSSWLFDIDTLTNSMNYVPVVVAGTSSTNISAHVETKNSDGCNTDDPKSSGISNPTATLKVPSAEQVELAVSLTMETKIPTVSLLVPTVCLDISLQSSSDPRIISKRDFTQQETPSSGNALTLSNKFVDTFGKEADLSNMETSIPVSPNPTVRIHKDHPKSQIISPIDAPVQTRHKSKEMKEQSFIAIIHQKTNPDLLQFCLFSCFLSQEEPKKIFNALKDPRVRPIGTKWVLKNKKDERGIVIRNKARLVAQGYTQEEGIDYEEVFALVVRIDPIRRFLAYASFMGFIVYQMDAKSAFLYGTIDEDVYVMQPPEFQDPKFLDRVYKVEKAMYGLHQAPRAWYGTLSKYLLDNGFQRGTIDQTLFIRKYKGEFLLVQVYVDDIIFGSSNPQLCREFEALMHEKFQMSAMGELTFFFGLQVLQKKDGIFLSQDKYVGDILKKFRYSDVRPDIMFAVCAYARYQVTPKECHLHAVKRIFRYLKGHPKLGLWYPKESPFDLVAYSDSDYGGATQDRKSTTGVASGCGQVLWIQNQTLDYGNFIMAMLAFCDYHNMIDILEKTKHHIDFHQIVDFLEASHIRNETTNLETQILATVDGKPRTISESSLRRHLKLNDEEGISSLPDTELFENLSLMGYNILPKQRFTFQKGQFSYQWKRYTRRSIRIAQSKALSPPAEEPASLLRDDRQGEDFPTVSSLDTGQDRENNYKTSALPHDSSPRVTSLDADEGNQDLEISGLKERVKFLEDKDRGSAEPTQEDAPIKGGIIEIGEEVGAEKSIELGRNDTEEMVNVLSSMEAANIVTSGVAATSVSPAAGVSTAGVRTISGSFPTISAIFTTASVVTPYTRRPRGIKIEGAQQIRSPIIRAKDKGKQKVVESEVPKKRKIKEQIYAQVAREMKEEFARENKRLSEQLARDSEIARLHTEEELKMMIEGLDRSNEVIAKHLQEYEQAEAKLTVREKIKLINELVKYQDHHAKILKYQAQQSKPLSKKEQREFYMSVLISHAGSKTKISEE